MQLELYQLALLALGYLLLLFAIGRCVDRGIVAPRLVQHPAVFVLSLGVFTGSLAYHGMGELAARHGFGFLGYYLGPTLLFLAAPALLEPLHRLCRDHQLGSLADLLTLRFPSPLVGKMVCVLLVVAIIPLIALQIEATTDVASLLSARPATGEAFADHGGLVGLAFCFGLALLAMSFAGQHAGVNRQAGLMAAMAFESLLKLVAFIALGAVLLWQVFGGPTGLDQWLGAHPETSAALADSHYVGRSLLLLSFASAVCMPHMFQMLFSAQSSPAGIAAASWGMPLYLLLFSLPVLPITWAVIASGNEPATHFYTVTGTGLIQSRTLTALVFLGGLAAGSGIVIVSALALSSMVVNHLLLPGFQPREHNFYRWLPWVRCALILAIVMAGYGLYRSGDRHDHLSGMGIASLGAVSQFLPGVLAVFYFPGINYKGFLAGLTAGVLTWTLLPVWAPWTDLADWPAARELLARPETGWTGVMAASLLLNLALALIVSRLTTTGPGERRAAVLCAVDHVARPRGRRPGFRSVPELRELFSGVVGAQMAAELTQRALDSLGYESSETRPFALRRLRDQIEANLSGQLGLAAARLIMERIAPGEQGELASGEDIELVEGSLDQYRQELTGIAADLDNLRRQHLQTLMNLPIGLCSLAPDREVVMWNDTMVQLTGLAAAQVVGSLVDNLPAPWGPVLQEFAGTPHQSHHKVPVNFANRIRWLSMYKSRQPSTPAAAQNQLVVVEDITEVHLLEQELIHSERLASIGRLAAGVAHEVGNPLTGIACLAQNIRDESDEVATREAASEIITQAERITGIVKSLVSFSHGGHHEVGSQMNRVAVAECVAEAVKLISLDRDAKSVCFDNQCDGYCVLGDFQQLLQVFVNLLSNARDASRKGDTISISSRLAGDRVEVAVADTGCGIPGEQLDRVFEPFFTTKPPGEGTGLGLALAFNILKIHDGTIRVESPDSMSGCGSRFTVVLREYSDRETSTGATAVTNDAAASHW